MFFDENGKLFQEDQIQDCVICWGASTRNEEMLNHLPSDKNVEFVIDKNIELHGREIGGYDIYGIEKLGECKECAVISVLIRFADSIIRSVHELNSKCKVYFYVEDLFDNQLLVQTNRMVMQQDDLFKYVHIFPSDSIFMKLFYEMIEDSFNIKEHLFILVLRKALETPDLIQFAEKSNRKNKNIMFIDDAHIHCSFLQDERINCNLPFENGNIWEKLKTSYRIFLHSAFYSDYIIGLLKKLHQGLLDKMTWVCWGDDSFCFHPEDAVVSDILQRAGRAVALGYRVGEIKKNYGILAQPIGRGIYSYLPKTIKFEGRERYLHDTVNIMVGHGPIESDCSEYALEVLGRFSADDIKIICPVSTEGVTYYEKEKEKIIRKGREIFGDKFIPLEDYMDLSEYYNFLAFHVDILVNAMTVLQSVTTLTFASCLGKKIFLRKEMSDALEENGVKADDIEVLRKKNYSDLLGYKEDLQITSDIHEMHNHDLIEEWRKLFS